MCFHAIFVTSLLRSPHFVNLTAHILTSCNLFSASWSSLSLSQSKCVSGPKVHRKLCGKPWKTTSLEYERVWKSPTIDQDFLWSHCIHQLVDMTPVLITVVRLAYQYNRNHCPPTFVWSLNLPSLNSILHPFRHLRMWLKSQMPSHKDMFLLADQNVVWICMDQHTAWWAVTNIDPAIARNIHRSYHCTNGGVLKSYNFAV